MHIVDAEISLSFLIQYLLLQLQRFCSLFATGVFFIGAMATMIYLIYNAFTNPVIVTPTLMSGVVIDAGSMHRYPNNTNYCIHAILFWWSFL